MQHVSHRRRQRPAAEPTGAEDGRILCWHMDWPLATRRAARPLRQSQLLLSQESCKDRWNVLL